MLTDDQANMVFSPKNFVFLKIENKNSNARRSSDQEIRIYKQEELCTL